VLDATLQKLKGRIEDKDAFMKTVRGITVDTARGPVRFDHLGNVVGTVYIRKVERKDGRLVNRVIHSYPNVSQFWTYKEAEFLKNPVYSRDWPPAKNLEP
jgi:branched-chain amino acid transport system substrate-binding protein